MESVFENNPNLKEVFATSDGEFFYKIDDAKNHAKNLDNKDVECVQNPNMVKAKLDLVNELDVDAELVYEAELKAKEEAELKAKEEAELKAKEEAELKAKEEAKSKENKETSKK